jgi:hypothetical protein
VKHSYRLDADDAIVTVTPWGFGHKFWWYSFSYADGTHSPGDADWSPSLRNAKEWTYARYLSATGKLDKIIRGEMKRPRAKWIKEPWPNKPEKSG